MSMTKENAIDSLLTFMNDEIERDGHLIENVLFFFLEDHRDAVRFMEEYHVSPALFQTVINTCLSRKLICHDATGHEIQLTRAGQERAISLSIQNDAQVEETNPDQSSPLQTTKSLQVGEQNKEALEEVISSLIQEIKDSNASDVHKKEAMLKLKEFITHPLVNTILGASAGILATLLGG